MITTLYYWTTNRGQFSFNVPNGQESRIYELAAKNREAWIKDEPNYRRELLLQQQIETGLSRFKRKIQSICKVELDVTTGQTTHQTLWKPENK